MSDVQIIRATPDHVPAVRAMVQAAYAKYVDRIGRPPAPMLADYDKILEEGEQEVWVLTVPQSGVGAMLPSSSSSTTTAGSIILAPDPSCVAALKINNLVVDPKSQGKGYGRVLMEFAEELARTRGLKKLTLFTNVMMWENIGLYAKLGFAEVGRRDEDGYERVYFEKSLGS
ncbi:acetyltransferase protein [Apiospora saccharicola]|uniref:Acetyltransferase protein n=1 Tax=Apiospora saccharicola TaxID=335842 RepID=A0ABR1UEL2_9PEZI